MNSKMDLFYQGLMSLSNGRRLVRNNCHHKRSLGIILIKPLRTGVISQRLRMLQKRSNGWVCIQV